MRANARRAHLATWAFFLLAAAGAAGACGGNVTVGGATSGTGAGSGTGTGTGSGTSGVGGAGAGCPVTAPAEGSACDASQGCGYPGLVCCEGTWQPLTPGSCRPNLCPALPPAAGSACSMEGQKCPYPSAECSPGEADCTSGVWTFPGGQPPACTCPAELPTPGTPCNPCCTASCSYTGGAKCGPSARCSPSGVWSVSVPPCPPSPQCSALPNPGACASGGPCRWLVPGCATATMPAGAFVAGCFDVEDCTPGASCSNGGTCVAVNTDPCWNSNCVTCGGGQADLCP